MGENWGAVIYDYKKGKHTPKQALKIVTLRILHATPGSIAKKRLMKFKRDLLKDNPELKE
jgi:hypothetical protein